MERKSRGWCGILGWYESLKGGVEHSGGMKVSGGIEVSSIERPAARPPGPPPPR